MAKATKEQMAAKMLKVEAAHNDVLGVLKKHDLSLQEGVEVFVSILATVHYRADITTKLHITKMLEDALIFMKTGVTPEGYTSVLK